jgi:fructokinase
MQIGIDLGGTKIEGIALGRDGRELARHRCRTPRGDYAGTIAAIGRVVGALEHDTGAAGTVGIAIPGAVSQETGLIKNANSTWLIGKSLHSDLEHHLAREVRIANDANCFALSEAIDGAGAGADVVFGVIVGTGTGGGIVVRGQVLRGRHSIAGEWGHNPLPWPDESEQPGPTCYCGRRGCIETFLSGPALANDCVMPDGVTRTPEEIVAAAAGGDPLAAAALRRYVQRMAKALASVINVLDPDVIVVGGGLSNIDHIYRSVPGLWAPYIFSDVARTPLLKARYGDSSGVRGAAWLWPATSQPS